MLPTTETETDAFLNAFQTCTMPKALWTHSAHIFTGACLVYSLGEADAIGQMRTSIRRFNESVGGQNTSTSGYHETVTLFWVKLLASLHRDLTAAQPMSRAKFATAAVERFAQDRTLLSRFYDYDVIASTEARRAWHPPTLRSFEETTPT